MARLAVALMVCVGCGGASGVATTPRSEHPAHQPARYGDALGTIAGTVTNRRTGAALANAMIIARADSGAEVGAKTDEHGAYKLALRPGVYRLGFYFDRTVVTRRIKVHRRTTHEHNVALGLAPGAETNPATPWHLFPKQPQSMPRPRAF